MKFGKTKETTNLDKYGSTVTVERNYVDSIVNKPVRRYYEFRVQVRNKKDEMTEYLRFSDDLTKDKLDPEFRIEHTKHGDDNGYYFVVKCYTLLDYADQTLEVV